jgi:hypothetical protein
VDEFTAAVRVIDDIGVTVHVTTADRLERAAVLAARMTIGMYDALFVQLARELKLPLLTSDAKLGRAVDGTIRVELLHGIGNLHLSAVCALRESRKEGRRRCCVGRSRVAGD